MKSLRFSVAYGHVDPSGRQVWSATHGIGASDGQHTPEMFVQTKPGEHATFGAQQSLPKGTQALPQHVPPEHGLVPPQHVSPGARQEPPQHDDPGAHAFPPQQTAPAEMHRSPHG